MPIAVRKVAIIVPTHKRTLSSDDEKSLRHLKYFLGSFDKYLVIPHGLEIQGEISDFKIKSFDKKHFRTPQAYNRLLLSKRFYKTFLRYEYILIYQLDSLVFSDMLLFWCNKGYDYIGAPWPADFVNNVLLRKTEKDRVGNGGFSLRKTASCLKVLNARWTFGCIIRNIIYKYFRHYEPYIIEDIFWSFEATKHCPDFKIASAEDAMSFSLEMRPRLYFEKNRNELPFGCHAWTCHDRSFWESYLIK